MPDSIGKYLIVIGVIIALIGVIIYLKDSIPGLKYLGNLPGDIIIKKENFSFYFPFVTSIIISVILSLFIFLFNKLR